MSGLKVAIDLFGGDNAPQIIVDGVRLAMEEVDCTEKIVLIGSHSALKGRLKEPLPDCQFIDVPDNSKAIQIDPLSAGNDPDSAIRTALRLHRSGQFDAVISAGSTGAQVKASLTELEKCHGITRPAIGTFLPTATGQVYLLDVGASLSASPHHLVQFAAMGHVYVRELLGIVEPRIGVLNVATEKNIGDRTAIEAYQLLSDSGLNFIGFVEGRDIPAGVADIVVTNGFVGNCLLKLMEGLPLLMKKFCPQDILNEVEQKFDYQSNGGEPLLGVNGLSIVCHGASTAQAIAASINKAFTLSQLKLHEKLESFLVDKFASYFDQVRYLRSFRRSIKWFSEQDESKSKQ